MWVKVGRTTTTCKRNAREQNNPAKYLGSWVKLRNLSSPASSASRLLEVEWSLGKRGESFP